MEKNITLLMAHADDEFLFGFPVIQMARKIICCTDDLTHPTRQWCRRRKEALAEICRMVGAECQVLRYDSGFRGLSHDRMKHFVKDVRDAAGEAEIIFTHNGHGEYGHWDHIILHSIVRQIGKPTLITDIALDADWYSVGAFKQGRHIGDFDNDMDFHDKCMRIYREYGAMGWTCPPVKSCGVYELP
jgi:LmbE family N-acetylglucosaminyl deacetylase